MLNLVRSKNGLKLCLILLCYYNFFNIIVISDEFCKILRYALFTYFFAYSYIQVSKGLRSPFKTCINGFFILLFLSMLMAWGFWNQDILTSFVSSYFYFGFFLYHYLHKEKFSARDIENGFYYASIVFLILFFVSHLVYPLRLVRGFGEINGIVDTSRGIPRIRLTLMGVAPIYFLYFFYINRIQEHFSIKRFVACAFLFSVIVMQLGRFSIALSLVLGIFLYLKNVSFAKKLASALCCIAVLYIMIEYVPMVSNMINLTMEQKEEGNDYVRAMAYDFYLHDVSPNLLTDIFGNGQYSLGKSPLGDYIDKNGRSFGLIPADVGYAYIFVNFGYLGWLFWLLIFAFVMFAKLPEKYVYVKYYVLFLYLSNFMGNTLLGGIHLLAISIYMIDKIKIKQHAKNTSITHCT